MSYKLMYSSLSNTANLNFKSEGSSCYGKYNFNHNNASNAATDCFFMTAGQYISWFFCEDLPLTLAGQCLLSTAQCMARLYCVNSLIVAAIHRRSSAGSDYRPRYAFALCSAVLFSDNVHPNPGPVYSKPDVQSSELTGISDITIMNTTSDGHCFLYSVWTSLQNYLGLTIVKDELIIAIRNEIAQNYCDYSAFYVSSRSAFLR